MKGGLLDDRTSTWRVWTFTLMEAHKVDCIALQNPFHSGSPKSTSACILVFHYRMDEGIHESHLISFRPQTEIACFREKRLVAKWTTDWKQFQPFYFEAKIQVRQSWAANYKMRSFNALLKPLQKSRDFDIQGGWVVCIARSLQRPQCHASRLDLPRFAPKHQTTPSKEKF